jgi:glucose-1-phosphate cytidylyltransferase
MKVVILCGGRGTRLREETEFRPKPMVPIGGFPILWHIMKSYSRAGHKDFIICLGYKGEMIKDYFRNYLWNTCDVTLSLGRKQTVTYHDHHEEEDWRVTLADTGEDSLTGYRVRQIGKYIQPGETFLLTYGDGVSDIDINATVACHQAAGKVLTISAVHPTGRFGILNIERGGSVLNFTEKTQHEDNYVNGGYMVCDHRLFDYLQCGPEMALERDRQLNCYRHEGFWQPMDTFQESQYLNQLWRENKAPWNPAKTSNLS